jgi:hypothetical protein
MIMQRSKWCSEAAAALTGLIDAAMLPLFKQWIESGAAVLWRVSGSDYVTWLITRVEQFPGGTRELVLDVIAGKNCVEIVKTLIKRAKNLGINSVRFETHHSEKLAKKFICSLGFERVATVFKVAL